MWRDWLNKGLLTGLGLNTRQITALPAGKAPAYLNTQRYTEVTGTSRPTAKQDLEELVALELLQLEGSGCAARYRISRNRLKNESIGSSPERDAWLIAGKGRKWLISGSNGSRWPGKTARNPRKTKMATIDELRPYAKMKPSGMQWLCHIPAHWDVRRDGSLFGPRREAGFPNLPIVEVSIRSGVRFRDFDNGGRKQETSHRSK